jgi:hypothetical protein
MSMRRAHLVAVPAGVAALVLAWSVSAVSVPAAVAPPKPCVPPAGLRSERVARTTRADGVQEVTEFEGRGEYRVTRCTRDGRLLVSQTVSVIADPDGGVVRVPTTFETPDHVLYALYGDPEDPVWAAVFRAGRAALQRRTIPPTEPTPEKPALADPRRPTQAARAAFALVSTAIDGCSTTLFTPTDHTWATRNYDYRINASRFGNNATTIASIVHGHTNWDTTRNGCALADITNLTSHHLGNTNVFADLDNSDGVSVVDKGPLTGDCATSIACTVQAPGPNGKAAETDQRFATRYKFSNSGAAGTYDYQAIATHESGHSIGLGHATQSNRLTMFPQSFLGTTFARTLARGDVRGLRARYP